jgi:segregation and condensation protein B
MDNLKPIIEALLLAATEPLTVNELIRTLDNNDEREGGISKKEILALLDELREFYDDESHGIEIVEVDGGYQLRTKSTHSSWIHKLNSPKPTRLSKPAIESLAIIAYRQPLTRGDVDHIRGVDSGAVIKGLLERHLIKIFGRKEEPGRPLLYGTTRDFLELFGLKDLNELPPLKELEEQAQEMMRRSQENEEGHPDDLEGLEIDSSDLQLLDDKERDAFGELDTRLKEMKISNKKTQEIISPPQETSASDETQESGKSDEVASSDGQESFSLKN